MKLKIWKYCFLLGVLSLTSCSWQEYFVIKNNSNSEITVKYKLSQNSSFTIFEEIPAIYKATKKLNIDWEKQLLTKDLDSSKYGVEIKVPAKSILKFGQLSNDHYSNHSQKFINDRIFNLQSIEIVSKNNIIFIQPENFDMYFKKTKGNIELTIK